MEGNNNKKGFLHPDHPKPITRRQFLAQGFLDGAGFLMMPTVLDMLLRAQAAKADCGVLGATAGCDMLKVIILDLAGGPQSLIEPVTRYGNLISAASYRIRGEPNMPSFSTDAQGQYTFGVPIKTNHHALKAIQAVAGVRGTGNPYGVNDPKILTNTLGATICTNALDDTHTNKLSPANFLAQIICGQYFTTVLGTGTTSRHYPNASYYESFLGGYTEGPIFNAGNRSIHVANTTALLKSFGYGPAFDSLSSQQIQAILNGIKDLNSARARALTTMHGVRELEEAYNCAISARLSLGQTDLSQFDPRNDPNLQLIFGIGPNNAPTDLSVRTAFIVNTVLKCWAPVGVITVGGCDYHYGWRADSDAHDYNRIGLLIGRTLALASRLLKPVLIVCLMDGSVSSAYNSPHWTSDAFYNGSQAMFYFHPGRRPAYARASSPLRAQLGWYTDHPTQSRIDPNTFVGNSPERCCYSIILNYLYLNNPRTFVDEFRRYVPETLVPRSEIDGLLLFNP